jgi:pimeloyl-ACP methyl ester carboxylesterase
MSKMEKENVISWGKGTPVVLLHSAMSSKLQWYRLMRSMSKDHLLVAVDFYGYGNSPFPGKTENFSFSDEITLVESLIKDVIPGDEPFHLVGHSYGGAVGLRFCYQAPERVRSLSLYEPVAYHLLPAAEEVLVEIRKTHKIVNSYIDQGNDAAAAEYFVDYWNRAGTFATFPTEFREILCRGARKLPLSFRALMEEPLSLEDYSEIKLPVCLMAGRRSPLSSRRIAELLADYLPNCRFHWVDSDHMAPVLQPELVNPIIETFIRGVAPPTYNGPSGHPAAH